MLTRMMMRFFLRKETTDRERPRAFDDEDDVKHNGQLLLQAIKQQQPNTHLQFSEHEIMMFLTNQPAAAQYRDDDDDGNYPLHAACYYRSDDSVLIEKLLEIFPQATREKNGDGDLPLHIAIRYGRMNMALLLQLITAYPDAVATKSSKCDQLPLHLACSHVKLEAIIPTLLDLYPEGVCVKDCFDEYPLHHAIRSNQSIEIIKRLVGQTDRSDEILYQRNQGGQTPFHMACYLDRRPIVEYLLKQQCPNDAIMINIRNRYGDTPLSEACQYGYIEVIQMLLQHYHIHVNATNHKSESALYIAITYEYYNSRESYRHDIVTLLLQHPSLAIDREQYTTWSDYVAQKIHKLELLNDEDDRKKWSLVPYIEIQRSLQEFWIQRQCQAYQCLLQYIVDWSAIGENARGI